MSSFNWTRLPHLHLQNDESIPVRSNKKKGLKSKKEVREEVQEEATKALKEIATKHKFTSGKWYAMYATRQRADYSHYGIH